MTRVPSISRRPLKRQSPRRRACSPFTHMELCGGFSWNGCHHPTLAGLQMVVIASGLYNMPIFGLVLRWLGHFAKASKHDFVERMKAGGSLALIPGVLEEATLAGEAWIVSISRAGWLYQVCLQFSFRGPPCIPSNAC